MCTSMLASAASTGRCPLPPPRAPMRCPDTLRACIRPSSPAARAAACTLCIKSASSGRPPVSSCSASTAATLCLNISETVLWGKLIDVSCRERAPVARPDCDELVHLWAPPGRRREAPDGLRTDVPRMCRCVLYARGAEGALPVRLAPLQPQAQASGAAAHLSGRLCAPAPMCVVWRRRRRRRRGARRTRRGGCGMRVRARLLLRRVVLSLTCGGGAAAAASAAYAEPQTLQCDACQCVML
jgi:hypothetical protein